MKFRSVRTVTWTVPDAAASAAAFERWLGYRVVTTGEVSEKLASFWGAPAVAGAACHLLQPASGEEVFLRFIQSPATPGYGPLKTFGWNAAEFHVADVEGLARHLRSSPFELIGGPRDLLDNGAVIALQVLGPGGEVLYLTEMRHEGMREVYGCARAEVDRIFIVVLGASSQPLSLDFYRPFAQRVTERRAFPIKVLANAHGLDPEVTRFDIASLVMEERFRIETDAYPSSARPRPLLAGHLPPGMCLVSVVVDELPAGLESGSFPERPYGDGRVGLLEGPDGERLELIRSPLPY